MKRPYTLALPQPSPTLRRRLEATTLYRPATLFYLAAMVLMAVPLATLFDMTIARTFDDSPLSHDFDTALQLSLVLSHGTGICLIGLAIMLMAPRLRWHLPRLMTLAMGAGAVATIVKMFVLRPRPGVLALELADNRSSWWWEFDWDLSEVAMFDNTIRSFPSATVVTATAVAVGLWVMIPRGRPLFGLLWVGVLMQRLTVGTHFLSDVAGGVAFGLLWAWVCYQPRLLGNIFDKMAPEKRWARRRRRRMVAEQEISRAA